MKLDVTKAQARLAELMAADERIADRGPIKLLPRPADEIPDVPRLRARMAELAGLLQVKRNYTTPKGHDLDGNGNPWGYNLAGIGVIEEIKTLGHKGQDRALPKATTILRVGFPSGEHLWFDSSDLAFVPPEKPTPPKVTPP